MAAIYRNSIMYSAVDPNPSVLNDYVSKADFATDYGNVDNTHDNQKSVLYAATAGDASTVNSHTVAANVPSGAVFTNTTYTITQSEQDGHILTFTPSTGSATTVTIPDANTTYTSLSEFSNAETNFITNVTESLQNYYKKSETYTQTEINTLISNIPKFKIEVYPSLESITNPNASTIYLIPSSTAGTQNIYDEYVWVYDEVQETGSFEKVAAQEIDLTQYYTTTQADTLLNGKGDTLSYNAATGDLQLKSGSTVLSTVTIVGGTAIRLADVTGASISGDKSTATISWTDPDDVTASGVTLAAWAGTKVVRKAGVAPSSSTDGTVVVNSTTKNQYSVTGFTDTGLTYGATYYYRFFPYTDSGLETLGSSVSVVPAREVIAVTPTVDGTLTYDTTEQSPTFLNYNSSQLTVTGNTGTNAGNYTATFTPKNDYCWSDYSQDPVDVAWSIAKADGGATLSSNSVVVDADHLTATVTVSNPTGTVGTPTTSDSSVATVSISGSTITISSVDETSGTATITIPIAASANYNAANVTISVDAQFIPLVDWATGSDADIVAMAQAADAGKIDLTEYWSVGQERTVSLSAMSAINSNYETQSAQDVVLVLVAEDTGVEDSSNPCWNYQRHQTWFEPQHTADQEPDSLNVYSSGGVAYNPYNTEVGFLANFPIDLKTALQTVSKVTARSTVTDGGGSEVVSSKIFLLSTTEVGLANENSVAEGSVYAYYSDYSANRRKKNLTNDAAKGNYSSATNPWYWWLRTPYSSTSDNSRGVGTDGALVSNFSCAGFYGISPAFVVPSSIYVSDTKDSDRCYVVTYNTTTSTTIADLQVGDLVKFGVVYNNTEIIWRLLEHNHDGEGTSSFESRDIITLKCCDAKEPNNSNYQRQAGGNNRYLHSNILQWLNSEWTPDVRTYPSFIFQQKDCLTAYGKIDNNYSGSGDRGWDQAPRRTWCNNQYKTAFPSTLLPAVKQVVTKTWTSSGTAQTSNDYFFLAAEKEIHGSRSYSDSNEANALSQWPHYATASNKVKNVSGSAHYWWLRSPNSGSSNAFCVVDSNGSWYASLSNGAVGLAVCGCI